MSILNGAGNLQGLSDLAGLGSGNRHFNECVCMIASMLNGTGNLQEFYKNPASIFPPVCLRPIVSGTILAEGASGDRDIR